MEETRAVNNKRIITFLLITFILAYGAELFFIMPIVGSTDENQAKLAQSLLSSIVFIPTVAAILTRLLTKEAIMGTNIMLSLNLKRDVKYYALGWFGTAFMIIVGAALYFVVFPSQFDPNMEFFMQTMQAQGGAETITFTNDELKRAMLIQILTSILLSPFLYVIDCFGEEWGFRGYLLPKMLKSFRVVPTLLVSGLLWGLWYAPLVYLGRIYGIGYAGFPVVGILTMCLFSMALGVLLSYLTIKTGSCLPAIMCRGVIYGFATISLCFTVKDSYNVLLGPSAYGLIGCAGFIALAVYLTIQLHKEEEAKIADGSRTLL